MTDLVKSFVMIEIVKISCVHYCYSGTVIIVYPMLHFIVLFYIYFVVCYKVGKVNLSV